MPDLTIIEDEHIQNLIQTKVLRLLKNNEVTVNTELFDSLGLKIMKNGEVYILDKIRLYTVEKPTGEGFIIVVAELFGKVYHIPRIILTYVEDAYKNKSNGQLVERYLNS